MYRIGIAMLSATLIFSAIISPQSRSQAQVPTETIQLIGLDAPVEVAFNGYGVPHVYATTQHDLLFTQGYLMASERFWQMDLARHTAMGRSAEVLGAVGLNSDRQLRTIGIVAAAQRDLEASSDETRASLEAFSAGINAFLADKAPADVAVEYEMLATAGITVEIEPWQPLDSAAVASISSLNFSENFGVELARAELIETLGPVLTEILLPPYPYDTHPITTEPGQLNLSDDGLSTDDVADNAAAIDETTWQSMQTPFAALNTLPQLNQGSNSWVISGDLTATGGAILANDPHISVAQPSVWYEIGLHCLTITPDCSFRTSGFASVGLPGIYLGHNEHVAWGITNNGADVQDLYVLTLNPDDPLQYRYNDAWRDFDVREEVIISADGAVETLQVRESVWGPVLFGNEDGTVIALRWVGLEGAASLDAQLEILQARNWDEFTAAAQKIASPVFNITYADVAGNIGFVMAGRIPIRAEGHDGRIPIDGSTNAFDWQGYIAAAEMPRLYNPDAGYIVNANNRVVDQEYPYPLIDVYSYGWRALRIEQLLQRDPDGVYTMDEMQAWQTDNYSLKADFIVPVLNELSVEDPAAREAVKLLLEWDRFSDADSAGAVMMAAFWVELLNATINDEFGSSPTGGGDLEWRLMQQFIGNPTFPIWDDVTTLELTETRDDIMRQALAVAYDALVMRLGEDSSAWRWADLHTVTFRPDIFRAPGIDASDHPDMSLTTGVGGGDAIVNANAWSVNAPYTVNSIVTSRQIIDMSNLDATQRILPPGQSGHPDSPHYADQLELWASENYRTAAFSPDAVANMTVRVLNLVPAD